MDTEVVGDLARDLLADADRMDDVAARLRGTVDDLAMRSWRGADSTGFCDTWRHVHDPALVALATRLRELGRQAMQEAADQDRVSGSGGATAAPVAVASSPYAASSPIGGQHDRDLLALAIGAYPGGTVAEAGGRYRALGRDELQRLGITEQMLRDDRTGFAATVYRGTDGSTVLSFRGSDGLDPTDYLGTNVPNGLGLPSPQGAQAIALSRRLAASVGADQLTIVGHSLGGHLAAAGAVATGARAVTFNSARLGDADFSRALIASGRDGNVAGVVAKTAFTRSNPLSPVGFLYDPHARERAAIAASGQIRNYSTTGEPLNLVQSLRLGPRALGVQVPMTDPSPGWLKRHGPDGLVETWDNTFPGRR
ncbi:WXG100 family type VII secretion target [Nocardioides currus]|uniref:DUF2974 domain-containing protein n=1 Tax=Nocardioides currus TaxID=2133958 RepID=A0A2R7YXW6_9ACTN|nr:WXG100 family type VII secretion target [Nocardioides currus]PUA81238.1 hypothetical protein C7S10_09395 [Nocardioides currus]